MIFNLRFKIVDRTRSHVKIADYNQQR